MSRSARAKYCSKSCKNAAAYERRKADDIQPIHTGGAEPTAEFQPVSEGQE